MIGRAKVRRVTVGAQAAAAAMTLALGVVIVVGAQVGEKGVHEAVKVEPVLAGGAAGDQAPSGPTSDQTRVDFVGIAERLKQMKNAPTPEPKPEELATGPGPDDPGPAADTGEIKYLGMITVGVRRSALLSIDGVQRVVSQGATIVRPGGEEVRVFSVQADYVVLSEGRERRRLEKAGRSGAMITRVDPSAVAPAPARPSAVAGDAAGRAVIQPAGAAPREDFEKRRFEAIQKALAEGRIDQEDANRMLERIERMREERENPGDR